MYINRSKEEKILKILSDFLNGLEDAVRHVKAELATVISEEISWNVIEPPAPVGEGDKAIIWLSKKLQAIQQAHGELKYEFSKNSQGNIIALRYIAPNEEVADDVKSVASWAFQKASQRATSGSSKEV